MQDSALSLTALLITIACAMLWSVFDAQRKGLVRHLTPVAVTAALGIAQAPLFFAWMGYEGELAIGPGYWAPGLGVLLANVLANVLFFEALRRSPLSATVPLLSLTPVFSALFASVVLNELLTGVQWAGIALVVAGAFVLNARGADLHRPMALLRALARERGSLLMVMVAALWSATTVMDKLAMKHSAVSTHAALQVLALAVVLVVWLASRGRISELLAVRRCGRLFAMAIVVGALALALQLTVIQFAHVGLVEAIKRAFGVLAAVVVGRLVFGEQITVTKAVAAVAIAGGVCMVVAPPPMAARARLSPSASESPVSFGAVRGAGGELIPAAHRRVLAAQDLERAALAAQLPRRVAQGRAQPFLQDRMVEG